ncbi:MAG TPA: response regulator transcription factor [Streptosporangiaceae bacterium]
MPSEGSSSRPSGVLGVALQIRHRVFRETLAARIDQEPDLRVVGTTAFRADIPRLCRLRSPHVVLVEIDAADRELTAMLTELRKAHDGLYLVGLHDHSGPGAALGVDRLVAASGGVRGLLTALRPPLRLADLEPRPSGSPMTDRELQILRLISSGYTVGQVADALQLAPRTVENHKRHIFAKLGTHSQVHAAAHAVRLGLLPDAAAPRAARSAGREPAEQTPQAAGALLRGRSGDLADQVARLLLAGDIPLIVETGRVAATAREPIDHARAPRVVVLIDPEPADWKPPLAGREGVVPRVLVVTSAELGQAAMVDTVLRGADAVISATRLADSLLPAFRLALAGYLAIDGEQVRRLVEAGYVRMAHANLSAPVELTRRERQILILIDRGHSVKQTARALGISIKTVESLQTRMFRKLGIRNRAEALVVAHGLGLLPAARESLNGLSLQDSSPHPVAGTARRWNNRTRCPPAPSMLRRRPPGRRGPQCSRWHVRRWPWPATSRPGVPRWRPRRSCWDSHCSTWSPGR